MADSEWAMSSISPAAARVPADGRTLRLSGLGDELLARQAARGSSRAFTALYERYYQPLYRYCRSIVREDADAQDALQSTFTSALAALQRDGRNAPLRPWLYRIAHNESISLLRRRKRDTPHETVEDTSSVAVSAEEEAAARARWQRVVEDLAELPERQRGSLLLRELAGLSHEEIAVTFGTSVGAAKQAIFEARQGLAELEEGRAMSCHEVRHRISEGDRRLLRGRRVSAHLRDCAACAAFATAIPARQADLRALAPLPPAAAATLLSHVSRGASSHGGLPAGSAASAAGIGKTAGTVIGWKAIAVAGVLATTAAGVTGLTHVLRHARPAPAHPPASAVSRPGHTGGVVPVRPGAGAPASHGRSASGPLTSAAARGAARARHNGASHGHSSLPSNGRPNVSSPNSGSAPYGGSGHSGSKPGHGSSSRSAQGDARRSSRSYHSTPSHGSGAVHRSVHATQPAQAHSKTPVSVTAHSPKSTSAASQSAGSGSHTPAIPTTLAVPTTAHSPAGAASK